MSTRLIPMNLIQKKRVEMNIDIIVTQYEAGGAQKAAINLANGLISKGHRIRLIFFYKKSEIDFFINNEVEVVFLQLNASVQKKILFTPVKLIQFWKVQRPDVVIALTHYANIITALCARFFNIPVIISHRNPCHSYAKGVRFIDQMLYRMNFYHAVTFVSRSTQLSFQKYTNSRFPHALIYNCVDSFDTKQKSKPCADSNYIVAIGRLTDQKNHRFLITTFAASSYTGRLKIIGEGPLKNELLTLAAALNVADRIDFLGIVANLEIPAIVKNAKAFVMPSLYEGMSNALLEAMVAGVYTIVSDIPAQREVVDIDGERYGSVIDLNDDKGWIDVFNAIDEGLPINGQIHEKLMQRYSCSRFVNDFLVLCESV